MSAEKPEYNPEVEHKDENPEEVSNRNDTMEKCLKSLGPEKLQEFQAKFREYDKDASGYLDKKEFLKYLSAEWPSMSPSVRKLMFNVLDVNHDKKVSWEEFIEGMRAMWLREEGKSEALFRMFFNACDKGKKGPDGVEVKKGYLTYKEFTKLLKLLDERYGYFQRKALFNASDVNKDGQFTFEELAPLLLTLMAERMKKDLLKLKKELTK